MSNNYSPDADDQMPEKKSSQQLLLLLLVLLIVLFGYLYFFTGLIKPRGEQPPKPQPVAETPVKSPLPPRPEAKPGETAKPAAAAAAKTPQQAAAPASHPATSAKPGAAAKEAAAPKAAPASQGTAAVKPAAPVKPAPAAKPAAVAGGHPAVPAAQTKPAKPAGPAGAQAKGGQPAAAPATEAKSPAGAEKKPAAKAAAQVKPSQLKPAAAKTATAPKPKAPAKVKAPAYALDVDGDLAESELAPVLAKLKQAGVTHVIKSKAQKGEPMHRLFLADFANRDEASEELERLKLAAPSAFMLKENGRYAVYAGSYLREAKAVGEQTRLQAKGVQLLLKSATTQVAVFKVRAGAFADQAAAERAARALKKSGLSVKLAKLSKSEQ